jgi:DNA polymerase-3 subunit delta'
MSLKQIYCQDRAIGILQKAFNQQRLGHAYIFAGIEGIGKYTAAVEWAKMLLCQDKIIENDFADSCGKCASCMLFQGQSHPDFHNIYKELYPFTEEGKNKKTALVQFPIDVIREFVLDKVSSRPSMGTHSIYVISETEKLNPSSQNAMLKVLEEPPAHCIIIMLCTSVEKLLPTTRSRCQIVRFGAIDKELVVDSLASLGVDKKQAIFWAGFCQGSIGQAMVWSGLEAYEFKRQLIQRLARLKLEDVLEITDLILQGTKNIVASWAEKDSQTSKSDLAKRVQKAVAQMMALAFADAMKIEAGIVGDIVNADQQAEIKAIAGRFTAEQAAENIETCFQSTKWVDSYVNEKLVYERMLIELAK